MLWLPGMNHNQRILRFLLTALLAGCGSQELDDTAGPVNPSLTEESLAPMPACGTALASFDGTAARSNGIDSGTGVSCAGQGAYGLQYQCVELVMRHFRTHYGLSWWGNARDLLANAPRDRVDVFGNGDRAHPPVPGDMLVWETGRWGHVALVTSVRAGAVDIIEQNVSGEPSGRATLPYDGARIGARWNGWVPAGWAHARDNHHSGGGGWSCQDSDWHGQQLWTCAGGGLHMCQGGRAVEQACQRGCFFNGYGRHDLCAEGAGNWSCASSAWQGKQIWTCGNDGHLYRCDGGGAVTVRCPSGCERKPLGVNDTCR